MLLVCQIHLMVEAAVRDYRRQRGGSVLAPQDLLDEVPDLHRILKLQDQVIATVRRRATVQRDPKSRCCTCRFDLSVLLCNEPKTCAGLWIYSTKPLHILFIIWDFIYVDYVDMNIDNFTFLADYFVTHDNQNFRKHLPSSLKVQVTFVSDGLKCTYFVNLMELPATA